MTDRELMQQALDALEEAADHIACRNDDDAIGVARKALRARLSQEEPEPLWIRNEEGKLQLRAPPQREWQGLTDEEINLIYAQPQTHAGQYARAIEAKLKEKNT